MEKKNNLEKKRKANPIHNYRLERKKFVCVKKVVKKTMVKK